MPTFIAYNQSKEANRLMGADKDGLEDLILKLSES